MNVGRISFGKSNMVVINSEYNHAVDDCVTVIRDYDKINELHKHEIIKKMLDMKKNAGWGLGK